jgi:hypothetical protein
MFLLRFILLLVLFYLIIQILGRFLFGYGRKNTRINNADSSFGHRRKEGDVYVDVKNDKKQKIISKDEGEYIKYEEIKDNKDT